MVKNIANFLYETGTLKHVQRSGWWLINVQSPENVAEHSFRAATIAYVLAKLENVNVERTVLMALFNDLHEARINDLHKVGHRYIDFREAETKAHKEQTEQLGEIGKEMFSFHEEFMEQKTKESLVARDADLLENGVQAKEYVKIGYKEAQKWMDNSTKLLKTKSAKKLAAELDKTDPNDWWQSLPKIER